MDAPDSLFAPCFIPQKASDNYSRLCHLITLLCGDLFRDILSRYIKPIYLRSQLDNNKQKLVNIFNKQQQNLIYPATGNTSLTTKEFDITIIYILLRNICNIPPHKAGWGNPPAKSDNSIAAGIEKIRLTRNLILAHSTNGMIEDPVFEKHWNDLKDVVVQIETQLTGSDLYKRGVDFLHCCNLTSVGTEADHNEEKSKQDGVDTIYDKRSARFAEFFDDIAEGVPVEKIARLKDFIQNSCKAEDITSLKQAVSARDCLRYLRDAKLFTSSDVIFVQYLFKRINCNELFVECYRYAEKQDALCFYEKPPANGYQNVLFHVKGNLSDYSLERIAEIRETLAVLLNCTSKEILIGGACPSKSFLLVLSIKETYSCKLLALEQYDKDKLTKLNIDYIIVDLIVINLEPSKEFGWNIYFDPKHFNREDENMPFLEEKSTVSPSQHSLSEPLPIPWRDNGMFTEVEKNQLLQNINVLVPPPECNDINLLVTGYVGSGKSSLVNTFSTVLRNNGYLSCLSPLLINVHHKYPSPIFHGITIQNIPGTKRIRVYDYHGNIPRPKSDLHKKENRHQAYVEDLKKVIDGHIIEGYEFKEDHEIKENSGFYRNYPTLSDKMHCVLFVVRANDLDEQRFGANDIDEKTYFSVLHSMQQYLRNKNIPVRLVLSQVDKLDKCVSGDLTKIFVSGHVNEKVQLAKKIFGLHDNQILPIANYVMETTQNIAHDVLALAAIENILNEALCYIKNII